MDPITVVALSAAAAAEARCCRGCWAAAQHNQQGFDGGGSAASAVLRVSATKGTKSIVRGAPGPNGRCPAGSHPVRAAECILIAGC